MKGQIAFKPSDEMLAAIEKQRQKDETRPACVMRLLGKLLGVVVEPPKRGRPWGKPDISHGAQQPPDC